MPETRAVESVHLGALAQLSVQGEEPLDLVLLEVRLPREGVHQLGLLLPDDLADLGHPAEALFRTASFAFFQCCERQGRQPTPLRDQYETDGMAELFASVVNVGKGPAFQHSFGRTSQN